jgi:cell division protein FtsQ
MPSDGRRKGPVFTHGGTRPAAKPVRAHLLVDEKTQRRIRVARLRKLGAALAVIALFALGAGLYFSPLMRVQDVEVRGATLTDPAEIDNLTALEGDSMFRLDTASVQRRLGLLPMIKSVSVEREWPNTVIINVTERTPWGHWKVGNDIYVIDAEGVVLPPVGMPEGTPLINDLSNPVRLVPGDRVDADSVQLAQSLLGTVPQRLILNVAAIEYSHSHGLAIQTDAGYRVVVGDSQDIEYKLAVWGRIEQEIGREAMAGHVLDLRFRDRPSFQ